MKNLLPVLIFLLPLLVTGCSHEELYNEYNKDVFSCDKQAVQYREDCRRQINDNQSYQNYQQQRKALKK